jgi:hypothetical protein
VLAERLDLDGVELPFGWRCPFRVVKGKNAARVEEAAVAAKQRIWGVRSAEAVRRGV